MDIHFGTLSTIKQSNPVMSFSLILSFLTTLSTQQLLCLLLRLPSLGLLSPHQFLLYLFPALIGVRQNQFTIHLTTSLLLLLFFLVRPHPLLPPLLPLLRLLPVLRLLLPLPPPLCVVVPGPVFRLLVWETGRRPLSHPLILSILRRHGSKSSGLQTKTLGLEPLTRNSHPSWA